MPCFVNAMAAKIVYICFCIATCYLICVFGKKFTENDLRFYRTRVKDMFYHAYNNYIANAYPYDELRPLSCDGVDTWGSFSLTLIDALDTLAVMGNFTEFRRVAKLLEENMQFDTNINVSVFETNIRVIGGLLSAHLLSKRVGIEVEPDWPCSGPLLRLAESVAHRILPAFDTPTKMPYGTVNLRHGVPKDETPITCTAGVTTFIVEFGTLSRLTGNDIFEKTAMDSLMSMWQARSSIKLVGNHIDVLTGAWTALDSGIGAGVDSYYEYLVKGAMLLQRPELMEMFQEYRTVIERYMLKDDWYMWVNMQKGQVTMPLFQSLEAYWPGLLSLVGDIETGLKSLHNYHQVWKQYGFTPEFYNIPTSEANTNREGYPLRPELIESIMYLHRATGDPVLLQMGVDILESIEHSAKTPCGYATIRDVRDHRVEDRMESFFLAETTKYLYLLFDPDNFIHGNGSSGTVTTTSHGKCILDTGGYVFNTEAHPIDMAAVYCCSKKKKEDDAVLKSFQDDIDLLAAYGLTDDSDFLERFRHRHVQKLRNDKENDDERRKKGDTGNMDQSSSIFSTQTSVPSPSTVSSQETSTGHSTVDVAEQSQLHISTRSPTSEMETADSRSGFCVKNDDNVDCMSELGLGTREVVEVPKTTMTGSDDVVVDVVDPRDVGQESHIKIMTEPSLVWFGEVKVDVEKLEFVNDEAGQKGVGEKETEQKLGRIEMKRKQRTKSGTAESNKLDTSRVVSWDSGVDDNVETTKLESSVERDDKESATKHRIAVKTSHESRGESETAESTKSFLETTVKSQLTFDESTKERKVQSSQVEVDVSPTLQTEESTVNSAVAESAEMAVSSSTISKSTNGGDSSSKGSEEAKNAYWLTKPKFKKDFRVLSCPAQPFLLRMSLYGEMFNV